MVKYKLSKYNFFEKQDDNTVVGINLINKNVFGLESRKYELLTQHADSLDELKDINENLFNALRKLGIIINEDIDEMKQLLLEHRKFIYSKNIYRLTIIPTLDCNFNCWYCYEEHVKGVMSGKKQKAILKHVNQYIAEQNLSFLQLDWFGGEPLLYFDEVVFPLSKKLKKTCLNHNIHFSNSITTNGSLMDESMIKKMKLIDLNSFQITFDGSENLHNKVKNNNDARNEYKITLNNIFKLCDFLDNPDILVRINYTAENLENIKEIIHDIPNDYKKKIRVSFQQVWQTLQSQKNIEISSVENEFINSGVFVEKPYLYPMPYKCYADLLGQAVITQDGKVFKCTARDFAKQEPDGYLQEDGNIEWVMPYYLRLSKTTIENDRCCKCKYLPACWGPCSQKVIETSDKNFDSICNSRGIEATIRNILSDFYKNKIITIG
ncbi:MAG: radical SAM protein [Tannerella sp.]|jgi:uncharacterized protein|nr:radical SAM protein [Tannerella sp.]